MRWAVVVVAALGCKTPHYGTYFTADGSAAKISFDHVEFFFANRLDGSFATRDSGAQSGDVYARRFVQNDSSVSAAPGDPQRATYLVPPGTSDALGDYVMVIARDARNNIVGVGESAQFPTAAAGELLEVLIPLEAADGVETWGTTPGCAAWNRKHGRGWVGVVRADDRDCDDVAVPTDCDDFAYCAAADGCAATKTLCDDPHCSISCPYNSAGACVPSICLPSALCALVTCSATSPADRFSCFAKVNIGHLDVVVATQMPANLPCTHSFDLPLPNGTKCIDPVIELAEALPDNYKFAVHSNGSACHFDIIDPPNPGMFTGDHHMLVSIDPGDGSVVPRPSFFFGVLPQPRSTCVPVSTTNPLVIDSCP